MVIHKKTVLNVIFESKEERNYREEILRGILLKPQNNLFAAYITGVGILDIFEELETLTKYTKNIKKGLIIKSLPKLYAITAFSKDINLVIEYIDSFHEGSISLYVLNNTSVKVDEIKTLLKVNEVIESDYVLKIEIIDDAECFCIDSPDSIIIQDIEKQLREYRH